MNVFISNFLYEYLKKLKNKIIRTYSITYYSMHFPSSKLAEKLRKSNKDNAQRLVKTANLYYYSPLFRYNGGIDLQNELMDKYNIKNDFTLKDKLMNIPTVLFLDRIVFVILSIIIGCILLYGYLFFYSTESSIHNIAYNKTYDYSYANYLACGFNNEINSCNMCNQSVEKEGSNISFIPYGGCAPFIQPYCLIIHSDQINYTEIFNGGRISTLFSYDDIYLFYRKLDIDYYSIWIPIVCNRTIQVQKAMKQFHRKLIFLIISSIISYVLFVIFSPWIFIRIQKKYIRISIDGESAKLLI